MQIIRIGLITTLDKNIGDDFIRFGIIQVLKDVFKGKQIEFICVNKHSPYTVYPFWHPVQIRDIVNSLPLVNKIAKYSVETVFPKIGCSNFDKCDLIVQCGAPVFWPDCRNNEWAKPLWHEIIGRLFKKIPVLNLAAGSCYPWERQSETPKLTDDTEYIKSILRYCRLTTARDQLAQDICKSVGSEVPLIPCSAFLAAIGRRADLNESGYVLINYMSGGGHYGWEQGIDCDKWEITIKQIISNLGKRHKLAFLCHDQKEVFLAKKISSSLPVYYPKTVNDYFDCVSQAKFAICNRMHASVGMAGMGIPSVAVCTDTRLLMVSELGLPVHYVKTIDARMLEDEVECGLSSLKTESERLILLQAKTWEKYCSNINNALLRV